MLYRFRFFIYSVVIFSLLISGCGKEEKQSKKQTQITPTPTKKNIKSTQRQAKLIPADDKDDLRFTLLYPESKKIAGWIKTEPVIGGGPEKIETLLPDLADILKPYAIENVSATQYERIYNGKREKVRCWLIRARNSDDAYGMFSVSCKGADSSEIGDAMRTDGAKSIFSVKGVYFGIFKAEGEDIKHLKDGLTLLAAKIMFEIASQGNIPMIVQFLTTEDMPEATVLFVRNLISMNGPAGKDILKNIGLTDIKSMNKLLELSKDVDFAVAIYRNKEWPGPDVIWIAKYPTAKQALRVYKNYRKTLQNVSSNNKLNENTLLKAPRGRFLLGCWTMETESLGHLMGKVYEHLP